MHSFFSFKNYFPFGAAKLTALSDELKQQRRSVFVKNSQHLLNEIWRKKIAADDQVLPAVDMVARMAWRNYSAPVGTSMIVYGTVGIMPCMFVHTAYQPSKVTKRLARHLGFFVATEEKGDVKLLSAAEWEELRAGGDVSELDGLFMLKTLSIENVYRSTMLKRMPKGYYNARYRSDIDVFATALHTSNFIIEQLLAQTYSNEESLGDTVFTFDKYPSMKSFYDSQHPPKRLCLISYGVPVVTNLMRSTSRASKQYTPTFEQYTRTFPISGRAMTIEEALGIYFSDNQFRSMLSNFFASDTERRVSVSIQRLFDETKEMYSHSEVRHQAPDADVYVVAAALVFITRLEDDSNAFSRLSVEQWLQEITYDDFGLSVARLVLNAKLASSIIFRTFLWMGRARSDFLRSWYLSDGVITPVVSTTKFQLPSTYRLLAAPQSSPFNLLHSAVESVKELSVYLFTLLGVRITNIVSSVAADLYEKCISSCLEAALAMEVLFPQVSRDSGLLRDCRIWIAAWLFTFKLIVAWQVRSDKIDALLFMLKNYDARASDAEKDNALFARLFFFSSDNNTPDAVGALLPALRDLRRYVDAHAVFAPPLNFDNVYNVQVDTLHWLSSENVIGAYTPVAIKYAGDVSPTDYGSIMHGKTRLPLERLGESLRRVFVTFFGSKEMSSVTNLALRELTSAISADKDDYAFVVRQLFDADRRLSFDIVKPRSASRLRVAAAHQATRRMLQRYVDQLSEEDIINVSWLAHSNLMKESNTKMVVDYTPTVVAAYSPSLFETPTPEMRAMFDEIRNPLLSEPMAVYGRQYLKSVPTANNSIATFDYKHNIDLFDIPLSFDGAVLTRTGIAARRALQGFPATFQPSAYAETKLVRQYNAYADFICSFRPRRNKERELKGMSEFFNTIDVQFRNHFKLARSTKGERVSSKLLRDFYEHVKLMRKHDESTHSWCLARDVNHVKTSRRALLRIPDEVFYDETKGRESEEIKHYCTVSEVPVTVEAVGNLLDFNSADESVFALTRYSPVHYFANAAKVNFAQPAALLLRMLAADYLPFDFYAPISAYIRHGLSGDVALNDPRTDLLYRNVGDYLTSRRGLASTLRQKNGFTGHVPVVDAYTRRGGIHQLSEALRPPTGHVVDPATMTLLRTEEELSGVLAAEVTRVEFTVHAVAKIHADSARIFSEALAQKLSGEFFNMTELYPVDEYTWFQFTEAVPAAPIPETKLRLVDVVGNVSKREREKAARSSRQQRPRLEAQIVQENNEEEYASRRRRFASLSSRITAYKKTPQNNTDVDFARDFADFYVRYVLAEINNTEDVYIGGDEDFAAFSRYYGTPLEDQRSAEDKTVIDAFLERPENVRLLISPAVPRWRVVVFGRQESSVLEARSHHFSDNDGVFIAAALDMTALYGEMSVHSGAAPEHSFFAMLRFVECLLRRPATDRLLPELSSAENSFIDAGLLEYMQTLETALGYIFGIELAENLDERDKMTYEAGLREEDRLSLTSTGTQGYLYEDVLNWYSSYLHLTYAAQNPMPRRLFTIESTYLSRLLLAGQKTSLKEKERPASDIHFYPWYDPTRHHYYLIFVYFPTFTVVAIDSLFNRAPATIEKYAKAIGAHYTSTKDAMWTVVSLKTNVPKQQTAHQCGDYTMSNIEYLIQWLTTNRADFEATLATVAFTDVLYSEEQQAAVTALAESFRTRVLSMSATLAASPPAASSVRVDDDEDGSIVILDSDDEGESEATSPVPSVEYETSDDVAPAGTYVYPACTVRGYEINAQRFGNSMRYVRYGDAPNVEFTPLARTSVNHTEEAALSYWKLRELEPVPSGAELVARMPSGDVWRRLMVTGFPYEVQPRQKLRPPIAPTGAVGPSLGVGLRILPLVQPEKGASRFAASPLPIYRPRTAVNSIQG